MPAEAVAYERGTELNEGLANYIQELASGRSETTIPEGGLTEVDPRQRGYVTGAAIAHLLDRVTPGWKDKVKNSLDQLLPQREAGGAECESTVAGNERLNSWAKERYAALVAARERHRSEFLAKPGWILVIASKKPLFPEGFDPMNVERVAAGEVLHRRYLKLASDSGTVEVIDRASLTEAAGKHPLFDGVRTCTMSGFAEEPKLAIRDGAGSLADSGVTLSFKTAQVQKGERRVTVVVE